MLDGLNGEIDIEIWPVEMVGVRPLDLENLRNWSVLKPGKSLNERKSSLLPRRSQKPCLEIFATSTDFTPTLRPSLNSILLFLEIDAPDV